jgi:putative Mn2+ efflux pump MntP
MARENCEPDLILQYKMESANYILTGLLAFAIAMDVFSVVYLNGFLKEINTGKILITAIIISVINAVMGLLGLLLGKGLNLLLGDFSMILPVALFFLLGLKIIIKSFKPKFHEMTWELHKLPVLAGYSAATGINLFLAGIALSFFIFELLPFFVILLSVYFIVVLVGIISGKKSNNFFVAARAALIGGVVLLVGSIILMLNLFGIV